VVKTSVSEIKGTEWKRDTLSVYECVSVRVCVCVHVCVCSQLNPTFLGTKTPQRLKQLKSLSLLGHFWTPWGKQPIR